jgi:hypothetical protein
MNFKIPKFDLNRVVVKDVIDEALPLPSDVIIPNRGTSRRRSKSPAVTIPSGVQALVTAM